MYDVFSTEPIKKHEVKYRVTLSISVCTAYFLAPQEITTYLQMVYIC